MSLLTANNALLSVQAEAAIDNCDNYALQEPSTLRLWRVFADGVYDCVTKTKVTLSAGWSIVPYAGSRTGYGAYSAKLSGLATGYTPPGTLANQYSMHIRMEPLTTPGGARYYMKCGSGSYRDGLGLRDSQSRTGFGIIGGDDVSNDQVSTADGNLVEGGVPITIGGYLQPTSSGSSFGRVFMNGFERSRVMTEGTPSLSHPHGEVAFFGNIANSIMHENTLIEAGWYDGIMSIIQHRAAQMQREPITEWMRHSFSEGAGGPWANHGRYTTDATDDSGVLYDAGALTTDGAVYSSGGNAAGAVAIDMHRDTSGAGTSFTIAYHAKFRDTLGDNNDCIVGPSDSGSNDNYFFISIRTDTGKIRFQWYDNVGAVDWIESNSVIANNQELHIAASYNAYLRQVKIYVNGVLEVTQDNSNLSPAIYADTFRVGNLKRGTTDINGSFFIGDLRSWLEALPDSEFPAIAADKRNYTP